jgi:hypothetical protein
MRFLSGVIALRGRVRWSIFATALMFGAYSFANPGLGVVDLLGGLVRSQSPAAASRPATKSQDVASRCDSTPMEGLLDQFDRCLSSIESVPGTDDLRRPFCACLVDVSRFFDRAPTEADIRKCVERAEKARATPASHRKAGARSAKQGHYLVEASVKDESFVFRDRVGKAVVFKARIYCFGVDEGDEVVFSEGGPDTACVSGEFLDLRTGDKCEVWCP